MSDEEYYDGWFNTPELQGELLNFQLNNPPEGLTTDDLLWFTYGEKEVRSWLPHMDELTEIIKKRKNLASVKYFKQQLEMRNIVLNLISSDSIDEINYLVQAGQKLLNQQLNNNH